MTAYTVEELAAMIIAPEPNIEDYHENGAYDSASFHEAYGVWETRIKFARQMLDLIAERNRLTAENRALQDDIVRLTADLVIEAEQHQNAAETCLSLKQELDASSVLLTRAQAENVALQARIDATENDLLSAMNCIENITDNAPMVEPKQGAASNYPQAYGFWFAGQLGKSLLARLKAKHK